MDLGHFGHVCESVHDPFMTHLHLMIGSEAFVHALLFVNTNELAILVH